MKNFTLTVMFSVPALVTGLSFEPALAQPSPGQVPSAPPAPGSSLSGQSSAVIEGTVVQYLMNHHGEIDGFLLSDETQVHFPPHMGKDLITVAKPNDPVSVQGYRTAGGTVVKAYAITNTQNGRSVVERKPALFDRPIIPPFMKDLSLVEKHAEGIVRVLLYGPRGELNGAVLEDRTIVRVPPHAAFQVAELLQVGQSIRAEGYGTENEYGRVIEATAMGMSGKPLILINDPGSGRSRR